MFIKVFFAVAIFIALIVLLGFAVWSSLRQARAEGLAKRLAKQAWAKFSTTLAFACRYKCMKNKGTCFRGSGAGGKISCRTCSKRQECSRVFLHEYIANVESMVRGANADADDFAWEFAAAVESELQEQQLNIKLAELQIAIDKAVEGETENCNYQETTENSNGQS